MGDLLDKRLAGKKVILLDAFGTVLHPIRSIPDIYFQVASQNRIAISQAELTAAFGPAFTRHFSPWKVNLAETWKHWQSVWADDLVATRQWLRNQERRVEFGLFFASKIDAATEESQWRSLVFEVFGQQASTVNTEPLMPPTHSPRNRPQPNSEQLQNAFQTLWHLFKEPGIWAVDPLAQRFIDVAKRNDLKVHIASNFDQRLLTIVDGLPELAQIDGCFISSDLQCRKPDPAFYDSILRQTACTAEQVLMIGDSWWEDFATPTAIGIDSLFLDSNSPDRVVSQPTGSTQTEVSYGPIKSFRDLLL